MPIRRGQVYFVSLNPAIGREQQGRRPVVVVSRDSLNDLPLVVTVVPGTRGSKIRTDYPQNARIAAGEANLPEETVFLTFQVRSIDHSRFVDPPVGELRPEMMADVEQALAWSLSLSLPSTGKP
jgi:mRNA interferase MazF